MSVKRTCPTPDSGLTGATENAGVENAGVAAMERQSNTKGCCTARRQSNVFFSNAVTV